jgi:hypothetical protein
MKIGPPLAQMPCARAITATGAGMRIVTIITYPGRLRCGSSSIDRFRHSRCPLLLLACIALVDIIERRWLLIILLRLWHPVCIRAGFLHLLEFRASLDRIRRSARPLRPCFGWAPCNNNDFLAYFVFDGIGVEWDYGTPRAPAGMGLGLGWALDSTLMNKG